MKIGIDAIDYYVPPIALRIDELAKARNIPTAKLEKGLGLHAMSLTDVNEDTASLGANALLRLIENNKIDPTTIGRIYLGTESAIDAAKPIKTFIPILNQLYFGRLCKKRNGFTNSVTIFIEKQITVGLK